VNNIILEKDYIYYILKILSRDLLRLANAAAAGERGTLAGNMCLREQHL
jgi:hypothetical protein